MWPSEQQQVRLQQELLRDSQERSILQNAQAVLQQPWIASPNPQLSFPPNTATGPTTMNSFSQVPHSATNAFPSSASAMNASQELHFLRLLRIRQERQALEERHALIKQHEQRMLEELMKQRSVPQQDTLNNMLRFNEGCLPSPRIPEQVTAEPTPSPSKEAEVDVADQNGEENKEMFVSNSVSALETGDTTMVKTEERKQVPKKKNQPVKQQRTKKIKNKDKPKIKDQKWRNTLEQLREYKEREGNCIVPRGYAQNPRLASWVAEQRKQYKLLQDGKPSSITQERIELLNELDFSWNAQEAAWSRHISDLIKYKEATGHCHVPLSHPEYNKLGLWVKEQRRHYTLMKQGKPSHMTESRVKELDKLGFCWDTHHATWLERLNELAEYKKATGSTVVPSNYELNPKLSTWTHHQRRQYKKFNEGVPCHITEERIKALNAIGFDWNPPRGKKAKHAGDDEEDDESSSSGSDDYDSENDSISVPKTTKRQLTSV